MPPSAQSSRSDNPQGEFRIQTKAMDLVDYTLRITENKDNFPNWTRGNLVKEIRDTACLILKMIVYANDIQRGGATPYLERIAAQEKAIRACSYLLTLIDLSQRTGRIDASKRQFWGQKVRDVKFMTMAWHKKETAHL